MKIYAVGGCVRDQLLGAPVADRDWVVVGATAEDMVAAGFRPVGRDFPVFLHPRTNEEYALARTERKTAPGYRGFVFHAAPDVTLEADLARRDLTINAMALGEDGVLVDPFGGRADLQAKVLRHVGPAFAEDPVRILRVARFAARLPGFRIADETMRLMASMVEAGEVDALVPERVWQELSRGLMEAAPSRMFESLRACGALARLLPEVDRLCGVSLPAAVQPTADAGVPLMRALDAAARIGAALPVRWAVLLHDLGEGAAPPGERPPHIGHDGRGVELARQVNERLRAPNDCRDASIVAAREHGHIQRALELDAAALLQLLERCDALRRPALLAHVLDACEAAAPGRGGHEGDAYPQRQRILAALEAARGVDAGAIAARAGPDGERIAQAVHRARVAAIAARLDG